MMRTPTGEMIVLNDRTQLPRGLGYALEHRTVMSRSFPSLFRDSHVHRLAFFFRTLRQTLVSLQPQAQIPRIVLLTPGSHHPNYFEHAFLANYLGFLLVQGSDLTVRNSEVWVKSLEGLLKVDVIFRQIEDHNTDPLELDGESHSGVSGLLEAVRAGNVIVANPPGVSVLENPALFKFMPEIGRFYLGREPRLAAVHTYWCGNRDDHHYVTQNLTDLLIKPINYQIHSPTGRTVSGRELTGAEQANLLKKIDAAPHLYVAQPYADPSQSPAWDKGLVSRPTLLRSFAVANENSYQLMPGGLARIGATSDASLAGCNKRLGVKDTWVTATEPEKEPPARPHTTQHAPSLIDYSNELPSRVIENLFWMGRYAERAESGLRLLRSVFVQLNGSEYLTDTARSTLLRSITGVTNTFPGFTADNSELWKNPEAELISIVTDITRPGSIAACLLSLINSAGQVKEMLSADTQRIINDIGDQLNTLCQDFPIQIEAAPEEALDPLVTTLLALSGVCRDSMIRGFGWRFLDMGKRLERSLQTITLLQSTLIDVLEPQDESLILESILLSVEALITFRRRHRNGMNIINALGLILLDEGNPRSLIYQLERLGRHLKQLPSNEENQQLSDTKRSLLEANTTLLLADLEEVTSPTADHREMLEILFDAITERLLKTAEQISEHYFDHTAGPRLLIKPKHWV